MHLESITESTVDTQFELDHLVACPSTVFVYRAVITVNALTDFYYTKFEYVEAQNNLKHVL